MAKVTNETVHLLCDELDEYLDRKSLTDLSTFSYKLLNMLLKKDAELTRLKMKYGEKID